MTIAQISRLVPLAPVLAMTTAALLSRLRGVAPAVAWRNFLVLSGAAVLGAGAELAWRLVHGAGASVLPGLVLTRFGAWMALLVQFLGSVIGAFSSRYLQGEARQRGYVTAFAGVLAAVQLLLLADAWLPLIVAWAAVGAALHRLLCFYPERPFALLAAHKKRIADRLADAAMLGAAALAWWSTGSGSLSALSAQLAHAPASPALQASALLLALAVLLRTALLPMHGWLIQVMEAPTPVSALLHAGVVNLGGFVLIRFAPLLQAAPAARAVLVAGGLASAALAGMVSLTRVSVKVRLAWSTVAQMGFMVLECGLGLYALAALHLLGHSLYKAQAFLSASSAVRDARLRALHEAQGFAAPSLLAAPLLAAAVLWLVQRALPGAGWPWWWSAVLALAWAPLLWLPRARRRPGAPLAWHAACGVGLLALLGGAMQLAHWLRLGVHDAPWRAAGLVALAGLALLYMVLVLLQLRPRTLAGWRRWSYAGFYVDEAYTRVALRWWPARWTPPPAAHAAAVVSHGASWKQSANLSSPKP